MILFAAPEGWIINAIILALIGVISLINKFFGQKEVRPRRAAPARPAPPPRPAPPQRRPEPAQAMVGQDDIDQFLEEVLPRGRPRRAPMVNPPVLQASPADPAGSRQAARPGSGQRRARPTKAPVRPPGRLVKELSSDTTAAAASAMESTERAVGRAGDAVTKAGQLQDTSELKLRQAGFDPTTVVAMLKSPEDARRAILLAEILGPPRSRRRR